MDSSMDEFSEVLFMVVKTVTPILVTFATPFITKGLVSLLGSVGKWGTILSAGIGALMSGVAAAGMGQSAEMSGAMATIGSVTGATAHGVMQTKPIDVAKQAIAWLLIPLFLAAGCYHNPRTWVEWNGHQAQQYHESGHGWTEKGVVTMIECDWVDLVKSSVNGMEYCPPKHRGTETAVAQVFESDLMKTLPAVIHGLAFIGGMVAFPLLMPATTVTQINSNASTGSTLFGSTIQGQPIQGLRFGGPLP